MCFSSSSLSTLLQSQASQRCSWSAVSSPQVPFSSLCFLPASSSTLRSCHVVQPGDTFQVSSYLFSQMQQTTPRFPSTQGFFVSVALHSFGFLLSFFTSPEVCSLPRWSHQPITLIVPGCQGSPNMSNSKFLYPVTSWMSQRPLKCKMARPELFISPLLISKVRDFRENLRKSIQAPRNMRAIFLSPTMHVKFFTTSHQFCFWIILQFHSCLFFSLPPSPSQPFTWTMATSPN